MRGLPPEVFEVRFRRHDYDDRTTIEVSSRMYDIRLGYTLSAMWGDPRRLADFVEHFVGGTVRSWYESRVGSRSGREMAQALMPHWEREIQHHMERIEYEDRHLARYAHVDEYRTIRPDQWEALQYGMAGDWIGPREDPKAKDKARQLLMRQLDDGQLKSFKKDGSFRVTAKDGKVYTIKTARSFNVVAEDGTKYCGQLVDTPIEDQMLAQKLLLQNDPDKFFKNANVAPAFTGDVGGFLQSGQGTTATEILMRQNEAAMWIQPRRIIGWNSNI